MSEGSRPSGPFEPEDAAPVRPHDTAEFGAESPLETTPDFGAYRTTPLAPRDPFPWPPAESASVAGAFVETWQAATFRPARFFRALPDRISLGSALFYYLPLGILIAGAELFWRTVRPPAEREATLAAIGTSGAALHPLIWFLLSPLLLLLSLLLSAAVTHALLRLFGGASRDYRTTTGVFAFAYSPMIFSVVPVIGTLLGFPWMIVSATIGLREAHHTSTGRAAATVLIPVVFALIVIGLVLLVQAAGNVLDIPLR